MQPSQKLLEAGSKKLAPNETLCVSTNKSRVYIRQQSKRGELFIVIWNNLKKIKFFILL